MLQIPKIEIGASSIIQKRIQEEDTSQNYGSQTLGTLFSTPALTALMIKAATNAVDHHMPEGMITVGTKIEIIHDKPTTLGMTVSVKAEVAEFDGQKILFNIVAYDEAGIIATGKHERMIVNRKMLFQKTQERVDKLISMV